MCISTDKLDLIKVFNYTIKELRRVRVRRIKIVPELGHGYG